MQTQHYWVRNEKVLCDVRMCFNGQQNLFLICHFDINKTLFCCNKSNTSNINKAKTMALLMLLIQYECTHTLHVYSHVVSTHVVCTHYT